MKFSSKKPVEKKPDDSLFGLLAAYKANNTYFRILINEEKKVVLLSITDNPKYFPVVSGNETYEGFRLMKRSEMSLIKHSVKYLSPMHIIAFYGDSLGLKITSRTGKITNDLDNAKRIYHLEAKLSQCPNIVQAVKKIIHLTPQKKYEIIEKYLANSMKSEVQE
jgi:hypothetical protein